MIQDSYWTTQLLIQSKWPHICTFIPNHLRPAVDCMGRERGQRRAGRLDLTPVLAGQRGTGCFLPEGVRINSPRGDCVSLWVGVGACVIRHKSPDFFLFKEGKVRFEKTGGKGVGEGKIGRNTEPRAISWREERL